MKKLSLVVITMLSAANNLSASTLVDRPGHPLSSSSSSPTSNATTGVKRSLETIDSTQQVKRSCDHLAAQDNKHIGADSVGIAKDFFLTEVYKDDPQIPQADKIMKFVEDMQLEANEHGNGGIKHHIRVLVNKGLLKSEIKNRMLVLTIPQGKESQIIDYLNHIAENVKGTSRDVQREEQ